MYEVVMLVYRVRGTERIERAFLMEYCTEAEALAYLRDDYLPEHREIVRSSLSIYAERYDGSGVFLRRSADARTAHYYTAPDA